MDKVQSFQSGNSSRARKKNTGASKRHNSGSSDTTTGLSPQKFRPQDKDGISGVDLRLILAECVQAKNQAGLTQQILAEILSSPTQGQGVPAERFSGMAMKDKDKSRKELIGELQELRRMRADTAGLDYKALFENMAEEVHFGQFVRDEAGRIKTWRLVDANPPTLKTWGRASVDEIKGKTTDEIFGPGATEHYLPIVEKIMSEGVPYSFEDYFPHLDKHFRFTSVPLREYFITTAPVLKSSMAYVLKTCCTMPARFTAKFLESISTNL